MGDLSQSPLINACLQVQSPVNLHYMSLGCGRKPEHPEKTHTEKWRTCSFHAERPGRHHCTTLRPLLSHMPPNFTEELMSHIRETVEHPFFASLRGGGIEKSSNAYSGNTSAALCWQLWEWKESSILFRTFA